MTYNPRKTKGKPNKTDIYIGRKIKERRLIINMSQQQLADKLDITFQQVQKYETGKNRVAASRLILISQALKTPLIDFYPGNDNHQILRSDREVTILSMCHPISNDQIPTLRSFINQICKGS